MIIMVSGFLIVAFVRLFLSLLIYLNCYLPFLFNYLLLLSTAGTAAAAAATTMTEDWTCNLLPPALFPSRRIHLHCSFTLTEKKTSVHPRKDQKWALLSLSTTMTLSLGTFTPISLLSAVTPMSSVMIRSPLRRSRYVSFALAVRSTG